jgi:hypothetical protein
MENHSIGNVYMDVETEDLYILSQVDDNMMVCLVSLNSSASGNRWCNPVNVSDPTNLSNEEFNKVIYYDEDNKDEFKCLGRFADIFDLMHV